jgi:hypothetical protein
MSAVGRCSRKKSGRTRRAGTLNIRPRKCCRKARKVTDEWEASEWSNKGQNFRYVE